MSEAIAPNRFHGVQSLLVDDSRRDRRPAAGRVFGQQRGPPGLGPHWSAASRCRISPTSAASKAPSPQRSRPTAAAASTCPASPSPARSTTSAAASRERRCSRWEPTTWRHRGIRPQRRPRRHRRRRRLLRPRWGLVGHDAPDRGRPPQPRRGTAAERSLRAGGGRAPRGRDAVESTPKRRRRAPSLNEARRRNESEIDYRAARRARSFARRAAFFALAAAAAASVFSCLAATSTAWRCRSIRRHGL